MNWAKDAYKGERAFLIGTGASLAWQAPGLVQRVLEREFTMGCNGLFLWNGMTKAPTVYCMIDHPAFPMWQKQVEALDTYRVAALRRDWPTETPLWCRVLQRRDRPLSEGHWGGHDKEFTWCAGRANVMWTLMAQLAFWLGFSQVYLLGVDGWADSAPKAHCYELRDIFTGRINGTSSPINERTQVALRRATPVVRRIYEEAGRQIFNANPDSLINTFPKVNLAEVVTWRTGKAARSLSPAALAS